jgi:hypothetical protein
MRGHSKIVQSENGPDLISPGTKWVRLAWESGASAKQQSFARKALVADIDCIDAYVILAMYAKTVAERLAILREGKEIGLRLWRPYLTLLDNRWWTLKSSLPFMRALHRFGQTCLDCGDLKDAEQTFRFLMKLNPEDRQHIRGDLAQALIMSESHKEALALKLEFPTLSVMQSSVAYLFDKALEKAAERASETARCIDIWNPHFLSLLGTAIQSGVAPRQTNSGEIVPRSKDEAIDALVSNWDCFEPPNLMAAASPMLRKVLNLNAINTNLNQ